MYTVYSFKFPDGTRFVGLTNQPFGRLTGVSGRSMKGQNDALHAKVQEVGWENIQWNVLAENLSKEEAYAMRNKYRTQYMNQGIWFKPRKRRLPATEILSMYEKELYRRIDARYQKANIDEIDVLDWLRDEIPEVTVEVYHQIENV